MAIKFSCRCGKHLKARESSAGRLTQCPRCGDPVAIPDRRPNHRGTDNLPASLIGPGRNPTVRQTERRPATANASAAAHPTPVRIATPPNERPSVSSAPAAPPAASRSPGRSTRRQSNPTRIAARTGEIRLRRLPHWWRLCGRQTRRAVTWTVSFGFTLGTFPVLLGLGVLLGICAGVWLRLLPEALQSREGPLATNPFFPVAGLAGLVLTGYCASVLNRVLAGATRRGGDPNGAVRFGLDAAFLGLSVWIGCFLAGPVVFAALGWLYWSQCGDLTPLDWIILAELLVPAVMSWLIVLTVTNAEGGLLRATPARVRDVAVRLGSTGLVAALCTGAVAVALGIGTSSAATLIHADDVGGYVLLMLALAGAVTAEAGVLRWLGGAYAARCRVASSGVPHDGHRATRQSLRPAAG